MSPMTPDTFGLRRGELTALVQMHTDCWGYTLWRGKACVGGACDFDWSAYQACEVAEKAMKAAEELGDLP